MKPSSRNPLSRRRAEVLATLGPWRTTSRAEIGARTGLSPATISRITRALVRGRVVSEEVIRRPGAGRPLRGLALEGGRAAVLGLSLLPPEGRALVVDLRGEVLDETTFPLAPGRGQAGIIEPLRRTVQALARRWRAPRLARVSLALPGQWSREEGVSLQYPRVPDWKGVPLRRLLEEWTRLPATLLGYAPAMALAEQRRRGDQAPRSLLAVEVGDHVALGAVLNGGLLEGATGSAGELGHVTIDAAGPVCYCGNRGCLEMLATCAAVEDEIRGSDVAERVLAGGRTARFEQVVAAARAGDAFAARLLGRVARTLGIGLAAAVNLMNPDLLLLGGRLLEAGDLVLTPLRASLLEHALPNATGRLAVETSALGGTSPALGAAALAIEQVVSTL